MDDIYLIQLLRKKGIISENDMHEFHELTSSRLEHNYILEIPVKQETYSTINKAHEDNVIKHLPHEKAKELVAKMYHVDNGRKYIGEKYDIYKAKELCERYRGLLDTSITSCDIYFAINSQYHNYVTLFKSWFTDNIDNKIIESAMNFWFMDDDCKYEDKIVKYLHKV